MNAKDLLISLRQDNLAKCEKKLKAALMFKILNGLAPDYRTWFQFALQNIMSGI